MSALLRLFLCLLACARAQFGNIQLEWGEGGTATLGGRTRPQPTILAGESRRSNLLELATSAPERLRSIVDSFAIGGCDACQTEGHWVAKVRQGILEMRTKRIRVQLQKRGIRCALGAPRTFESHVPAPCSFYAMPA
mmetsp:Transcript_3286/g.9355  ORF Transcript_3286/g.9355 Transcript_3286/m.9355 type:complete len:137 (+) Transcript_3286:140-550(+)